MEPLNRNDMMGNITVDELVSCEFERFSTNEYRGNPQAPEFDFLGGVVPALISAPHAVTHIRDGRVKPSEDFTGSIALAVAQTANCHALVATRTGQGDPNWDPLESCAYKQALCSYIERNRIEFLIDLHGMVAASEALAAIGSADGSTAPGGADERAAKVLQAKLAPWSTQHGKPIVLNGRYGARGENTIARTVARQCGIPALQVEVATQLRVPARVRGHMPRGEKIPFTGKQLPLELRVRRAADPAAVSALITALCAIVSNETR